MLAYPPRRGLAGPFRAPVIPSRALFRTSLFFVLSLGCALPACVEPPDRADAVPASTAPKRKATIPADGWNDAIAWRGLDEGLAEAAKDQRPIMMVVHTAWCPKCRALKQLFNQDAQLERLSEQFVMIHVDQDVTPAATLYSPDGQYIPRVMFLDAQGKLDESLSNGARSRFRYFYSPEEDLVAVMREALERHGNQS